MSVIAFEIVIIILLALLNGLFAMSEIAVVSSRKARLQRLGDRGNNNARLALALRSEPGVFLSTVQVGITLIGVLAGAFGGATIAGQLAEWLHRYPMLAPYAGTIGIAVVVVGITYLSLIVGELVPKRIALNNPERIAALVAAPMHFLARLGSPVVSVLTHSTEFILWLLRVQPSTDPSVTEEEVRVMIRQGTETGVFEAREGEMVEGILRFGDRKVGALMTPRTEIVALFADDSREKILAKLAAGGHSKYPLCEGSLDNVLGVVHLRDVLIQALRQEPVNLPVLMKEPLIVPETTGAISLLEAFKASGKQMALVIDEYGGLQGLITNADILDAIAGDPLTAQGPLIARRRDGSWLVDGAFPIDEFRQLVGMDELPGETGAFQTVGGFVMSVLGRIPVVADTFTIGNVQCEVVDMDGLRVDKIIVKIEHRQED